MKSYLLPGLDGAQRQRLLERGVRWFDWGSDALIQEDQLQAAMEALGATATEQATEYEGMYKLQLRYRPAETARVEPTVEKDTPRSRARAQYIRICSARVQAVVTAAQNLLVQQQQQLPGAYNQFAQTSRAAALAGAAAEEATKRAEFGDELARIRENPQVKDVRVVPGSLLVYTRMLYATNPGTGRKHEIGEFLLRIRLDGRDGGVRWYNATRRIDGVYRAMNAPNIYADGSPCAHEMNQTLIELIAQFQFAVVTELAIQFVETTNEDEFGKTVDRWPCTA